MSTFQDIFFKSLFVVQGYLRDNQKRNASKILQPTFFYFLGRNLLYFFEGEKEREHFNFFFFRFDADYHPGRTANILTTTPTPIKNEKEMNFGQDSTSEESLKISLFYSSSL